MKGLLKAAAATGTILLLLLVLAAVNSTRKGYIAWFIRVSDAVITVNGVPTKGWLHSTPDGRAMFFTRADSDKAVTYDLIFPLGGRNSVVGCGSWVAPRLPFIPIGDVNPPCLFAGGHAGRDLNRRATSVSFTADDGAWLEARW